MQPKYKLIYFEECPNAAHAKKLLQDLGLDHETIVQDDLSPSDFYRSYTSPTLLRDSEIIFGESTGASCGGCSIDLPSLSELKARLAR